jgi:Replication protein
MCTGIAKGAKKTSLDNRETTAGDFTRPSYKKDPTPSNYKRALIMKSNRVKGLKIAKQLEQYVDENQDFFLEQDFDRLERYIGNLRGCASNSLFRKFPDGDYQYIHSHTCKHKLCPVCNANRKVKIRRIYDNFFSDNPELLEKYDFMHLMLSVPHTKAGYKDVKVYSSELLADFKQMRDLDGWKNRVYAGQYSVEFTKGENGLHIHLHAMVLVEKANGSRNDLHAWIFREWNRITAWSGAKRQEFSPEELEGIAKSLAHSPHKDFIINQLDPRGSTHIHLETFFQYKKDENGKFVNDKDGKRIKLYISTENSDKENKTILYGGIMECLKYQFEPAQIYFEDSETVDCDLLVQLLFSLQGKRLHGRFNKFYREKKLSLIDKIDEEEKKTDLDDVAGTEIVHPQTGEVFDWGQISYEVIDIAKMKADGLPVKQGGEGVEALKFAKGVRKGTRLAGPFDTVLKSFELYTKQAIAHQAATRKRPEWANKKELIIYLE